MVFRAVTVMSVRSYLIPPHPVELFIFGLSSVTSATSGKNKTKRNKDKADTMHRAEVRRGQCLKTETLSCISQHMPEFPRRRTTSFWWENIFQSQVLKISLFPFLHQYLSIPEAVSFLYPLPFPSSFFPGLALCVSSEL